MGGRLERLWDRWCDFGNDHPHRATLIVIALFVVFMFFNIVFHMIPLIILVTAGAAGMIYFAIYDMVRGW